MSIVAICQIGLAVSVRLHVHTVSHLTGDQDVVEVNGSTVGQCLKDLVNKFPEVQKGLFDKDHKLLNYVDVYVNGESAYPEELAKLVKDGDELHIIFMIAGG